MRNVWKRLAFLFTEVSLCWETSQVYSLDMTYAVCSRSFLQVHDCFMAIWSDIFSKKTVTPHTRHREIIEIESEILATEKNKTLAIWTEEVAQTDMVPQWFTIVRPASSKNLEII